MYGCESCIIKKAECRRIDAFELLCWRRLESLLDCKEIQPVHSEGNQTWTFIGRIDAEAETPILWHFYWCEKWTHLKRPWCWERLKAGEEDDWGWDGWVASLIQWTWVWASSGVGDGQGSLACCSPWGHKESDMTEWMNWTELNWTQNCTKCKYITHHNLKVEIVLMEFLCIICNIQGAFLNSKGQTD